MFQSLKLAIEVWFIQLMNRYLNKNSPICKSLISENDVNGIKTGGEV